MEITRIKEKKSLHTFKDSTVKYSHSYTRIVTLYIYKSRIIHIHKKDLIASQLKVLQQIREL